MTTPGSNSKHTVGDSFIYLGIFLCIIIPGAVFLVRLAWRLASGGECP